MPLPLSLWGRLAWNLYPWVYDLGVLNGIPYRELMEKVAGHISQEARSKKWQRPIIIDACCGTGNMTRAIRERLPESQFYGLDLIPGMLSRAQRKNPNIKTIQNDLLVGLASLPKSFADVIILVNGFYPQRGKPLILKEFYRVLKPDGCLVISDPRANARLGKLVSYHIKRGNLLDWFKIPLSFGALAISGLIQYGERYPFLEQDQAVSLCQEAKFKLKYSSLAYGDQNYFLIFEAR